MKRNLTIFLVILLLAAAYRYTGDRIRHHLEQGITASLPRAIGPAQSYTAQVYGSVPGMLRGNLNALNISGKQVQLANGMRLAQLDVAIKDITLDVKTHKVSDVGDTTYSASLTADQLRDYMIRACGDIPGLEVTLHDGYIGLSAEPEMSGFSIGVKAEATLVALDQKMIKLNVRKVTMAGFPAPSIARDYLTKRLKPILDITSSGLDATIKSATVTPGLGHAQWHAQLEEYQSVLEPILE